MKGRGLLVILITQVIVGCASSAGEGAAIGAGVGGIIGAVVSVATGDREAAAQWATVGATVGGIGGYLYGMTLDNEAEALRKNKNNIDAQLTSAKKINEAAQKDREEMLGRFSKLQNAVDQTGQQARDRTLTRSQLRATRDAVYAEDKKIEESLKSTANVISELEVAKVSSLPEGQAAIGTLEQYRNELKENARYLASIKQRM